MSDVLVEPAFVQTLHDEYHKRIVWSAANFHELVFRQGLSTIVIVCERQGMLERSRSRLPIAPLDELQHVIRASDEVVAVSRGRVVQVQGVQHVVPVDGKQFAVAHDAVVLKDGSARVHEVKVTIRLVTLVHEDVFYDVQVEFLVCAERESTHNTSLAPATTDLPHLLPERILKRGILVLHHDWNSPSVRSVDALCLFQTGLGVAQDVDDRVVGWRRATFRSRDNGR